MNHQALKEKLAQALLEDWADIAEIFFSSSAKSTRPVNHYRPEMKRQEHHDH